MGAVALCLRTRLRQRRRALLGLVLLVGLAGGLAIGALGVARRTSAAFDRMVERTNAPDLMINPNDEPFSQERYQQLHALPGIDQTAVGVSVAAMEKGASSFQELSDSTGAMTMLDGMGYDLARPVIRDGRMPDPEEPDEVYLERSFADERGIRVGDVLPMRVADGGVYEEPLTLATLDAQPDFQRVAELGTGETGSDVALRVVGIGAGPDSIVLDEGLPPPGILLTPAFWAAHDQPLLGWWGAQVRLAPTADVAAFKDEVQSLFADTGGVVFQTLPASRIKVDRAVEPEVVAVEIFAVLMAAIGLLLCAQAIARRLQSDAADNPTLDALGTTRTERFTTNLMVVSLIAVAGIALSVLVAVLLSPIGPVGVARAAEPHAGLEPDWSLLLLAAPVLVALVVVVSLHPAWRSASARGQEGIPPRSGLWTSLSGSGLPVSAVTGIRFALDAGRSQVAVPVRSTLFGAATAVAVLAAVLTFSGSLNHLLDTPRLFGSGWDAAVDGNTSSDDEEVLGEAAEVALDDSAQVDGYAQVDAGEVTLAGRATPAVGIEQGTRPVGLTMVEGRAPQGRDEVVLGSATMRDLGLAVGDTVAVAAFPREEDGGPDVSPSDLVVVGRAVLPGVASFSGSDKPSLGRGAIFTVEGLTAHAPVTNFVSYVVTLSDGATPASLQEELSGSIVMPDGAEWFVTAVPTARPSDIVSLDRLRFTPIVLSGLLVLVVAATVANALLAAIRRRRRDLAVLEVFGATRRQVMSTVAWQASTIAVVGIVVGVPVGVVAGRWIWTELASSMDTVAPPIVPALALAALALVVLLLTNLVSLGPGLRASRTRPAVALRSE